MEKEEIQKQTIVATLIFPCAKCSSFVVHSGLRLDLYGDWEKELGSGQMVTWRLEDEGLTKSIMYKIPRSNIGRKVLVPADESQGSGDFVLLVEDSHTYCSDCFPW